MDNVYWNEICDAYALGALTETPLPVSGGLQHRLYRVATTHGLYAVKILNPRLLDASGRRSRYDHAERVAQTAAEAGLPVIAALPGPDGLLLTVGETTCMIFPWHTGTVMPPTPSTPDAACQIGRLMGRLHSLRLEVSEGPEQRSAGHPDTYWVDLTEQAQTEQVAWAGALVAALPELLEWNRAAQSALQYLGTDSVMTHRDMDQKNVLWSDSQTPWLLDWEDAGPMNPMLEVMGTALNWAGQSVGTPSHQTFITFLQGYEDVAVIDKPALRHAAVAVLDKWLIWLEFNMRRSLIAFGASNSEQSLACDAVVHALATLKTLAAETPVRLEWCDEGTA